MKVIILKPKGIMFGLNLYIFHIANSQALILVC